LIEEAYEVADAIASKDMAALVGELGDLQLQVVYHAQMADEVGAFDLTRVIEGIADKMVRRHPHVFGDHESSPGWESIKATERAAEGQKSALDGVAGALPALTRAHKIQKRAARTGFDWPDADGPLAKVDEEINELEMAENPAEIVDEMGDLLFATVNWARHLEVDPEAALRAATAKFERRFKAMEASAGAEFDALSLDEKEQLWTEAKKKIG
jgi:ATP diphosphatase